jgi:hypothetical protein
VSEEPTFTTQRKRWKNAFVLDAGKLSRIVDVLEQRAGDPSFAKPAAALAFSVKFRDGRTLALGTLQDVLALDNSMRNPVTSLGIRLGYYPSSTTVTFSPDIFDDTSVDVAHPNSKIANGLFAELEEQVERTFSTELIHKAKALGGFWLITAIGLIAVMIAVILAAVVPSGATEKLTHEQASALDQSLASARTDSARLEALVATQRAQLALIPATQKTDPLPLFTARRIFFVLPGVLVLGSLAYMVVVCYPRAVFAWGDYGEHFQRLLGRRRTIGAVVVVALIVGIVGNLFVWSLPALR